MNEISVRCDLNHYAGAAEWVSMQLKGVEKASTTSKVYKKAMSYLKMLIDHGVSNKLRGKRIILGMEYKESLAVSTVLKILANLRTEAVKLSNLFITGVILK